MLRLLTAALCALGLLCASPASAVTEITTNLTFNAKGTIADHFSTAFGAVAGAPSGPAFTTYGGGEIAAGSTRFGAVSTPDFYYDAYFFLGVAEGASPGTRHLILGANQSLAGQDFASLFPAYSEDALIDAIVGLNAGTVPDFGAEYQLVSGFQADFGSQYAFSLEGTGYMTAFSSGEDFGTIATSKAVSGVPEPVTWVMMIAGLGMVGAILRRRPQPGQVSAAIA